MHLHLGPQPPGTDLADYYSTLSTADLQRETRARATRPLPVILNQRGVTIDRVHRRVLRDSSLMQLARRMRD